MVGDQELVQNQRGVDDNAPSSPKLPHGLISPFLACPVGRGCGLIAQQGVLASVRLLMALAVSCALALNVPKQEVSSALI